MKIEITGKHVHVKDKLKDYARGKAEKLGHFYERIHAVHCVLDRNESGKWRAEFVCSIEGGKTLVAGTSDGDPNAALDLAQGKMEGQLRKLKEKLQDRHREGRPEKR